MDNSQSVNDTICQIDEISNIEKDGLPSAPQSTESIHGDHQLDSTNGVVLSATINVRIKFIPNIILLNDFLFFI